MHGTDRLSITYKGNIDRLPEFLKAVYRAYRAKEYQKRFPELDHIHPLKHDTTLLERLNKQLRAALLDQRMRFHATYPSSLLDLDGQIDHFLITYKRRDRNQQHETVSRSSLHDIAVLAQSVDSDFLLEDIHVRGKDGDGNSATPSWPITKFVCFEVTYKRTKYVHMEGNWFSVSASFEKKIARELAKIRDITAELALPDWQIGMNEGKYNANLADADNRFLNYDVAGLRYHKGHQKIEACDLLAKDMMIHVKRGSKSAVLSHLFAQATTSATLLRSDPDFREWFYNSLNKQRTRKVSKASEHKITHVYAIGWDRKESIKSSLFLFSKISLAHHARILSGCGFKCAICKIPMTP